MEEDRLFIVFLAVAVVVLLARGLAGRLRVPDAIVLVLLGLEIREIVRAPGGRTWGTARWWWSRSRCRP